jgi:uncharacterized protein
VMVDAGPLVAILDRRDEHHLLCRNTLRRIEPPLLTTWPVVTEVAWMLRKQAQSLEQLYASVKSGLFRIVPLDESALADMAEFAKRYSALQLQLADLSLLYLSRREQYTKLFTLDRRDFAIISKKWQPKLILLPEGWK